ncbi:MAG: hypothetical protein AAF543_19430 [Pseudomonadota bacterium]
MNRSSGGDLLIRPASGHLFTKVTPFQPPADVDHQDDDQSKTMPDSADAEAPLTIQGPTVESQELAAEAGNDLANDDVMIRPASRLKALHGPKEADVTSADPQSAPPVPAVHQALGQEELEPPSVPETISAPSMFSVRERAVAVDQPQESTAPLDPVQQKFDRLTEGLLESL